MKKLGRLDRYQKELSSVAGRQSKLRDSTGASFLYANRAKRNDALEVLREGRRITDASCPGI
jgi:hypothetical protein